MGKDQVKIDFMLMNYYIDDVYIRCICRKEVAMVRTQIYLTDQEKEALQVLAKRKGKKQSELIREAIDQFIVNSSIQKTESVIDKLAGIWKDREDLPAADALRKSWERQAEL